MPETTWSDGDVATAALLNQIEDQIVVTCTSATRPTGTEGRLIFETDTDKLMVYDGATWNVVTGSDWNDFTPSWNNLTIGNASVNDGAWHYQPGGVLVKATISFGSTTSISGSVSLDLPASLTARSDGIRNLGHTYALDSTAGSNFDGLAVVSAGSTVASCYADDDNVTSTHPFTWTTSDILGVQIFVAL